MGVSPTQNIIIRMQIQGQRAVLVGATQTAGALRGVGTAANQTSSAFRQVHHRSFLMNQALFTLRRYAYSATLAFTAMAAATGIVGLKFNMVMESNLVAMSHFLGGVDLARSELDRLYEVAARTPFEFQEVVEAERRFLAFGYTLQDTRKYLDIIGDTAAGLGGNTAEAIQRLTLVFGQIKATGRILGQDMLQLQQIGINTTEIFEQAFGPKFKQMMKGGIGELQIPSEIAIPILMAGLEKRFKGMSAAQAKTTQGMLTTLHDYYVGLSASIMEPLSERIRTKLLPDLVSVTKELRDARKAGASMADLMRILDRRLGTSGTFLKTWEQLNIIWANTVIIFKTGVIPTVKVIYDLFSPLAAVLLILVGATGFLADHTWLLRGAVAALTVAIIVNTSWTLALRTAKLLTATANYIWAASEKLVRASIFLTRYAIILATAAMRGMLIATLLQIIADSRLLAILRTKRFWILAVTAATKLARNAQILWNVATWGHITGGNIHRATLTKFWRVLIVVRNALIGATIATWGFTAALLANPITWIVLGIIAAGVALYFLTKYWDDLNTYVKITIALIWPFGAAFAWVANNIDKVSAAISKLIGWIKRLKNWVGGKIHSLWRGVTSIPGLGGGWPGLQAGGHILRGGISVVGERGPELLALPGGATVAPLDSLGGDVGMPQYIQVVSKIELDRRQIGEAVSEHRLERRARR